MNGSTSFMSGRMADIYNSAVAAFAISSSWELGILDLIREPDGVDLKAAAAQAGMSVGEIRTIVRILQNVGIVDLVDEVIRPGDLFRETCQTKSFFYWFTRGNGEMFSRMPAIMRQDPAGGRTYSRNPEAIAIACQEISEICYDPWFWELVDNLGFAPAAIADLGCGSGARVLQLLRRFPGAQGVGVDISAQAISSAKKNAVRAGQGKQADFVQDDVNAIGTRAEFEPVDLVTSFMMGHDFWPRENCVATLDRLAKAFPNAKRLILGDATSPETGMTGQVPVFTMSFELAHDIMGKYVPTVAEWKSVFDDSSWRLRRVSRIDICVGEVIFELEPR